jgi:hypothetical protein
VAGWVRRHGTQVRHAVVSVVAFGSPTAAAFTWHLWSGLVALGVAALLTDYVVDAGRPREGGRP